MEQNSSNWPFDQPRNCASITTRQVIKSGEPILHVAHATEDHGWSFVGASGFKMEYAMLVCLHEIIATDIGMHELADLPPGWEAHRESKDHPWTRIQSIPDLDE
jgi:hypothetical protein